MMTTDSHHHEEAHECACGCAQEERVEMDACCGGACCGGAAYEADAPAN